MAEVPARLNGATSRALKIFEDLKAILKFKPSMPDPAAPVAKIDKLRADIDAIVAEIEGAEFEGDAA